VHPKKEKEVARMSEYDGKFFIGREYDIETDSIGGTPTLYDPDDLTTHGVVVGMTGSGKTGLCVDILEEAALNGIPAIIIDPKGDISNLLLHFPELSGEDFKPWVDVDIARREGVSVEEYAQKTAEGWKAGLEKWGISSDRILQVREAVDYSVYSPGSDAGRQISILKTLDAPDIPWEDNREAIRERVASTATALLGLVDIDADPMRSREHILLANIFETSWQAGKDLDLEELIRQVQSPPFEKLGALELEQFFPADDRFQLAMSLNSFLASPSFQAWTEGEVLDPQAMLWTEDGRPRHSVFYLAHLSDRERMFFVTLLLSSIESWLRSQQGSPSLKAMIYFDEVLGFLPPVKEPPSKGPLIRLLKRARAFGMGLLLTTQNPIDLDYKALSNAGTWFIGRLQTEQDKARLLDGLETSDQGKVGFNRKEADQAISKLGKRVFLLHNVHEKTPQLFHTRWAMAYLKGPITRAQLPDLNQLAGASSASESIPSKGEQAPEVDMAEKEGTLTRPAVPAGLGEYFFANNLTVVESLKRMGLDPSGVQTVGLYYRPALFTQASARILDRKSKLDIDRQVQALVSEPDRRGVVRWENHISEPTPEEYLDTLPLPDTRFEDLEAPLSESKTMRQLQKDFIDFVYRNTELRLQKNTDLDLIADPGMTTAEFRSQLSEAAREARDEEIETFRDKYRKKMKAIQKKLAREQRELGEDESEHSARKIEEMATHFENVLGLFGGSRSRRRISTSMSKRRMTSQAKADIEESRDAIEDFERELEALEIEMETEIDEIEDRWAEVATQMEEVVFTPFKKDIHLDYFGVAWIPYWQLSRGDQPIFAPASLAIST
jgi:hypothetical protein